MNYNIISLSKILSGINYVLTSIDKIKPVYHNIVPLIEKYHNLKNKVINKHYNLTNNNIIKKTSKKEESTYDSSPQFFI